MNLADLVHNLDLPETDVASNAWDLARSRQRERRRRIAVGSASAAMILLVVGISAFSFRGEPASPQPADRDSHGSLSAREFDVATNVAQDQIDRLGLRPLSATATSTGGFEANSNTGHSCTSGTLLKVKLIGDFHAIPHGSMPGQPYEPTTAVLITADPESGRACLIGVATGEQEPEPGSVTLPVH